MLLTALLSDVTTAAGVYVVDRPHTIAKRPDRVPQAVIR